MLTVLSIKGITIVPWFNALNPNRINKTVFKIDNPLSINAIKEDTNGTETEPPNISKKLLIKPIESGSKPIIADTSAKKILSDDFADAFLRNIFDQDIKDAKRRNMVYIGRDYQKKMKDAKKVQRALDEIKKPMHMMNKMKAQMKTKEKLV